MTQTHFAGLNTAAFAAALEGRPVLVSYADVVRRPGVWADEILPRLQAGAYTSAILDSGAFTELTTPGFSVSIDAYVAFCQAHGHLFDQVVTLDDIAGDLATTWKNTAALEAAGLDVVPVFHGREPWAVLDHYCKRYRRVGLGFARDAGRIAKDQGEGLSPDAWLERALAVCEAHGVAVHGFGMTRYARERGHARLTTTDSTTWIAEYRALRNHRDATHSVSGDAAALLGPYLDEDLVQVVLWSYLGTGADAEVDACIAGASGQARTVLRRFNGEELARVLAMIDARAAAQRAEIRAASQASGSVCEPAQVDEEAPTCHFCGDERVLEVFELWPDERAFQIRTCCEAYQEGMREELSDPELLADPVWRRGFATWFEGETGWKVRRPYVSQNDLAIRLDFGLDVCSVTLGEAKAFVAEHHRHVGADETHKPPVSWRWGHAVRNGADLVAVAMVGRPVARMIDGAKVVEVTRLCVNPQLDQELAWNACSMLYAEAAREAKRRGFEKIITYTLESESGHALKASGWAIEAKTRGGSWSRPSRARQDVGPTCPKVRWAKVLRAARASEERRAA